MEDRWEKVRQIVREECERIEGRILASMKSAGKIKLAFENGRWIGITDEQLEAWKHAYPAVDIQPQLKLAAAWIVSNPMQAPKSNYPRFLNTWLTRQQNQASLHAIPSARSVATKFCAYCERKATGAIGSIDCCDSHTQNAMDGERPPRLKLA